MVRSRRGLLVLLPALLAGCGRRAPAPTDTGSRSTGQRYFEALIRRDPAAAYAELDPTSRQQVSESQFARLAQNYERQLGFAAQRVQVWAHEERGDHASVHVALTGRSGSRSRRYRDAVRLRRHAEGWGVVLAPSFGRTDRR